MIAITGGCVGSTGSSPAPALFLPLGALIWSAVVAEPVSAFVATNFTE